MGASLERSEPVRGATWDDFDTVVGLLVRQSRDATGIALREEFVRTNWELPSFEVGHDNWITSTGGYASLTPGGRLAIVAPDDATADVLVGRAVIRARERGYRKIELVPLPRDATHSGVLARYPFELEVDLLIMWRALAKDEAEPGWPDDFRVRTFEADDAAAVHALLDEAYSGWDATYVPVAHEDWKGAVMGDVEFDPTTIWLVERDGVLAASAIWWESGWLKDIVVRTSERGRGLGGALLDLGFSEFARRGKKRAGLKVDAANPTGAVSLYEKHGFIVDQREQIWALSL